MSPRRLLAAANGAVLAAALLVAATAGEPDVVPVPAPVEAAAPVAVDPSPTADPPPAPVASPSPSRPRTAFRTGWLPYATVGPVVLHVPGDVVELVGLHQSGHDGAQPQSPTDSRLPVVLLDDRGRDTGTAGAADVVVDPAGEVRAPVTGRVVRGGTYTLYCEHVDEYLVVEPDERPGWEVKLLHVVGLQVAVGDRVEAGVTRVAEHARVLPFASQVEERSGTPAWPHVHVEVVDPAVVDRPSGATCD